LAEAAPRFERWFGPLRCASFAMAIGSAHCGSELEIPPPYTPPAVDNPRSCSDLRTRGVLAGNEFSIDGKRANCAAEGLECVLQADEVLRQCDAGGASATCAGKVWRLRCDVTRDAGAGDAP
jgi:hypothetical protein